MSWQARKDIIIMLSQYSIRTIWKKLDDWWEDIFFGITTILKPQDFFDESNCLLNVCSIRICVASGIRVVYLFQIRISCVFVDWLHRSVNHVLQVIRGRVLCSCISCEKLHGFLFPRIPSALSITHASFQLFGESVSQPSCLMTSSMSGMIWLNSVWFFFQSPFCCVFVCFFLLCLLPSIWCARWGNNVIIFENGTEHSMITACVFLFLARPLSCVFVISRPAWLLREEFVSRHHGPTSLGDID
jgi:hypothetical protein